MYPVWADKDFLESVLKSVAENRPIVPQGGEWTVRDMVAVAGVMSFAVTSHGPVRFVKENGKLRLATIAESSSLAPERQEAIDSTFLDDISLAIEGAAQFAMAVKDGEYDEIFESHAMAVVSRENGEKKMQFLSGRKTQNGEA